MKLRPIEFVGGPKNGSVVHVDDDVVSIVVADGAVIYLYQREEIVEGPKVREIFRSHPRREKR
jgi:hypothetical protein